MPKKLRLVSAFVLLSSIAGGVLFHRHLLTAYAELLRVDNARPGADLILILSGHPESRVPKAIDLYRRGFGDSVMVTRACDAAAPPTPRNQYTVLHAIAAREGLDIPMLTADAKEAQSTFDEALQAADYARAHGARHLIVVTDAFHTARARYTFEKVFAREDVHATVEFAAAEDLTYDETNWWHSREGLANYLTEPIKFLYYFVR